jgi:hypothetical protein
MEVPDSDKHTSLLWEESIEDVKSFIDLCYETFRIRNLRKFDRFRSKLASSIASQKHICLYKHTNLQQITKT